MTEGETNGKRKGKKKRQKIQNILHNNQNLIILNIFPESLLSGSFPLLQVTVTSPPQVTLQNCAGLWICCGEQLRFQSGSTPVYSWLQCPQLSELVCFLLWELSISFYIFHSHRVCLVDRVDLICRLYRWWEVFGVFF